MLTIRKRGRYFHIRGQVRIGKEVRVVKEHSTGCHRREAAEAYRAKLQHELSQQILHGHSGRLASLTFADAGIMYLSRPGSPHRTDIWRLEQLNEHMGEEPLASIGDAWRRFKEARCKGLAPATVDRFRAVAQAALNTAAEEHKITVPKLAKVKFSNQITRYLTMDEQERLLASYVAHVQPIILTLCYEGCRTQEALQLQWRHVDLARGTLYFDRTKNGEPRTVPIHPRVMEAIQTIRDARGTLAEGHVFLNRLGQPYADTRDYRLPGGNPLRKAHKTACRRAGITEFRVHDWRHHWASRCVMEGIDLETIKRMGGWKSLRMLERYAAVDIAHMETQLRRLA